MKLVKATAQGFYKGERKRAGAVFEVPDNAKSQWFVDVELKPVTEAQEKKPKAK